MKRAAELGAYASYVISAGCLMWALVELFVWLVPAVGLRFQIAVVLAFGHGSLSFFLLAFVDRDQVREMRELRGRREVSR